MVKTKKDFLLRVRLDKPTVEKLDQLAAATGEGNRSALVRQLVFQALRSSEPKIEEKKPATETP